MKLYASGAEIAALEAALDAAASGEARAAPLVALAWQLRQRDNTRALQLSAEAQPLLADKPDLRARDALTRSEILALRCQLDEAEDLLAQARRLLAEPGIDPLTEGDALLTEGLVAKARGQRERELEAYERSAAFFFALGEKKDAQQRHEIAQAWHAYENAFSAPESTDAAEPVVARPEGDPASEALRDAAWGLALSRRHPARAAELFLRAAELARQVGMVRHAVVCTMNAGSALQGLGEFDRAAACYESAAAVARQTGWPALIGSAQTRLGAFLQELGLLEEARSVLSSALDTLAAAPAGINRANACSALAVTLLSLGRGIEAVGPMSEAIRMYREAQSTDNLAMNLLGMARAQSAAGQPQAALASLEEAQALIERHGLSALVVGVCLARAEIHQRHAELPAPPDMTLPNAALHFAEATLGEGLKIAHWKPPASLLVLLADAWASAGDMARAFDYARKALVQKDQETAQKLSHPLALLLRDEGRGGAPSRTMSELGAPASPAAKLLTPKEGEILQLLARNYSNKEIATALEMGEETVKWHLKKVFSKLEAGSRKHAVTRARSLGVISFSS